MDGIVDETLLQPDDPPAFEIVNAGGRSAAFLICDHASNRIPRRLGTLGLSDGERADHIAWDPGAAHMARRLSVLLDAPLVLSGYSRLVIDCNRPLANTQLIAPVSGGVTVPGNAAIAPEDRAARIDQLHQPYHAAIEDMLEKRRGRPTLLLSIHSFTPDMGDGPRPWPIAIAYGRDDRLARLLIPALRQDGTVVGDNQPYAVTPDSDYSIPVHGERHDIPHVLVETRQDGIRTPETAAAWADKLAQAYRRIEAPALRLT
ncbi:N-formylglutamate amidohydrolase [Emcibacter sp. SYSU 3D8]|uniref:N-formylglutamate amidohydrolase n=1 Tax=Emcibacter sp. SYSU 3D8 TaxID=3133969 RepID=UPI0031FEB2E6